MVNPVGVRTVIEKCMNIKPGERVLVVTDYKNLEVAETFLKGISKITETSMVVSKPSKHHGEEPSRLVAEAMKLADVVLVTTTKSISHTKAVSDAVGGRWGKGRGVRLASMPGITKDMLYRGALTADHGEVEKITKRIGNALKNRKTVRVKTEKGTNLEFSIKNREIFLDTGIYHKKGEWGNLPAGEVCAAPVEGTTEGKIVVDGAMFGRADGRMRIEVKNGLVKKVSGSSASDLNEPIKKDNRTRNIAEFGIGTNPKARLIGNVLESEKVYGTVHIGFGNNTAFGGRVRARYHLDGVILKPTVWVDGKILIEKGAFKCL